jgi:hypothetical protein
VSAVYGECSVYRANPAPVVHTHTQSASTTVHSSPVERTITAASATHVINLGAGGDSIAPHARRVRATADPARVDALGVGGGGGG